MTSLPRDLVTQPFPGTTDVFITKTLTQMHEDITMTSTYLDLRQN
jgi:hypothetical protein